MGFFLKKTHRHVSAGKTAVALVSERRQHSAVAGLDETPDRTDKLDEGFIHKITCNSYMQVMMHIC